MLPDDFDMFDRTRESEKIIDVLLRGLWRQTCNFYTISTRIHVLQKSQKPQKLSLTWRLKTSYSKNIYLFSLQKDVIKEEIHNNS